MVRCRYWRSACRRWPAARRADADPLDPGGRALLVDDEELWHEPEPARVAAAAANLGLEYSRLRAEIQARVEQVRASRARIVEPGETARLRLERDLHDGAQQRLVTSSLALGIACGQARAAIRSSSRCSSQPAVAGRPWPSCGNWRAACTRRGRPRPGCRSRRGAGRAVTCGDGSHRGSRRAILGPDRGRRLLRGVRGTRQRSQARASSGRPGHDPAAGRPAGRGQRRGPAVRAGGGVRARRSADRVASVGGALQIDSPPGCGTRPRAQIPCP